MTNTKLYVREWRLKKGLSQTELAQRAYVRQATISNIETGAHTPHEGTVVLIAAALGIRPMTLLRPPASRRREPQHAA